jgi:hypothetical protein
MPGMTQLEMAGERRLRQLLAVVNLLALCLIGAVAIHLWRLPAGANVYFKLQQSASFTYMFIWMGVAAIGALGACHRRTLYVSLAITFLLFVEGAAHAYFYQQNGRLYHPWARAILDRFEPHPILVGVPHPGRFGGLSHDESNRRTTVNEGKVANPKYVYVFGGSATYDVAVEDSQTWASDLSRLLGPTFAVENYGVPGYGSIEGMIQSLFVFRDVKPVCAIYYGGGNDLRNSHVEGLKNDYSDSYLRGLVGVLGVGYRAGFLENNVLFLQLIARALSNADNKYGPWTTHGEVSDREDTRLSAIVSENIKLTAAIAGQFGVKAMFAPQVLNFDFLEQHYSRAWWPYIPAKGVRPLVREMNLELEQAARESGAIFLPGPLSVDWTVSDFADQVHFSAAGAAKFAASLADDVAHNCR